MFKPSALVSGILVHTVSPADNRDEMRLLRGAAERSREAGEI